ncbi:hypothetical protein, partial [Providencia heimbachae]
FAQLPESHSLPMFIGISLLCAYKQLELFWLYTRHTSSCLGVAFAQLPESHSLPMFIGISLLCAYKQLELFWLYTRHT